MKAKLKLILFTFTFLIISLNIYSTPLSGSYTIGNGGNYTSIQSAFDDATAQGICGPVIFNIIAGTYNETVEIDSVQGSDTINTLTLQPITGNPSDVIINGVQGGIVFNIGMNNLIIDKLTFGSSSNVLISASFITLSNTNFNGGACNFSWFVNDVLLKGNENIGNIDVQAPYYPGYLLKIIIVSNRINGNIRIVRSTDYSIEKNTIGNGIYIYSSTGSVRKNTIIGSVYANQFSDISNNFIFGTVYAVGNNGSGFLLYNTIVGGSLNNPTLSYFSAYTNFLDILNNIVINPSGGTVFNVDYFFPVSNYNNYYNGGNNRLIEHDGVFYNSVSDFYNATGSDAHSYSFPVIFVSPTDLHLDGTSIGDRNLAGVPLSNPIYAITDDIDDQTRGLFTPYKGADEVEGSPLSVPLSGTYTIGNAGNYTTIQSAFSDAQSKGMIGPIIFNVMPGTYNENVVTGGIPGSSAINTVTLTSQTGNSDDVLINGSEFQITLGNLVINKLKFGNSEVIVNYGFNTTFSNNEFNNSGNVHMNRGSKITISNNKFNGGSISNFFWCSYYSDFFITGNENIGNILIGKACPLIDGDFRNIRIVNNTINGRIDIDDNCYNIKIEENSIGNGMKTVYAEYIAKNNITGDVIVGSPDFFYDNFVLGTLRCYGNIMYNTIVGGSLTIPTLIGDHLISNNIIINLTGGPALKSTSGIFFSDYNDFYNGGNTNLINYLGIPYDNVADFYNASGLDQHSNSHPVTFLSSTDLHLAGSSIGDEALIGFSDTSITDDIDGETRSQFFPYKGADENTDFPLPVELAAFTSSINKNNVSLNWTTSSEVNNLGFDIERKLVTDEWIKLNFVRGHKNSNTPQSYTYEDKNLSPGNYKFRLKQIDFNGNYKYYNLYNEVIIGVPEKYSLSQNFPNPFNPSTIINYKLPVTSYVLLKVYDAVGKSVTTLVNEKQDPGSYNYQFSNINYQLSSGVYFYKLEARDFVETKRMILLK